MSDVADRLRPRASRATARPAATRAEPVTSVWVSGAAGATWAMLVGLSSVTVLTVIVWAMGSHSGVGIVSAARFGGQLWLLAHHAPLRTAGGSLAVPPLFLTLALGLLLARASAIVARGARCDAPRDVATVVAAVAGPYAVLAAILAGVARTSSLRPSISASLFTALLVGGIAATIGAARGSGLARGLWRGLPRRTRLSLDAAGRAGAVLLGAGALVLVISLIAHAHDFTTIAGGFNGATGSLAMVMFSLLLVPNAIVFAVSYLTGAGFAVGTGTTVGLGGSHLGAVPAFPLLAAVPSGGASPAVVIVAVLAVVAAGATVGWRVATRSSAGAAALGAVDQARTALLAAGLLGVALAVLAGLAGGAAGPGRMRALGPSPWKLGLFVATETAAVAVIVVLLCAGVPALRRRVTA